MASLIIFSRSVLMVLGMPVWEVVTEKYVPISTPDIVVRHLVCLNPYKAAGRDGFHPKVL